MKFVRGAIEEANKSKPPLTAIVKTKEKYLRDLCQLIAGLIFDTMLATTRVRGSPDEVWHMQYVSTWAALDFVEGPCWTVVSERLARLLFTEIKQMDTVTPNFIGAKVVGLVLNVFGLRANRNHPNRERPFAAVHRLTLQWARRNYLTVRARYPDVAKAMLIGGIDFDESAGCLRKTYAKGLSREPDRVLLKPRPGETLGT